MNRPAALEPQNRWLLCATAGLGLCLASTEYERYTALWVFGTRTPEELAFIMLALAAALALGVAVAAGSKARLSSKGWLLAVLALGADRRAGCTGPTGVRRRRIFRAGYGKLRLPAGGRAAVRPVCGILPGSGRQESHPLVRPGPCRCRRLADRVRHGALGFGAGSGVLLHAGSLRALGVGRPPARHSRDLVRARGHSRRTRAVGGLFLRRRFLFWERCARIALINVLLLSLHDQAMALPRTERPGSRAIQVSAGIASVASGALFFPCSTICRKWSSWSCSARSCCRSWWWPCTCRRCTWCRWASATGPAAVRVDRAAVLPPGAHAVRLYLHRALRLQAGVGSGHLRHHAGSCRFRLRRANRHHPTGVLRVAPARGFAHRAFVALAGARCAAGAAAGRYAGERRGPLRRGPAPAWRRAMG